MIPSPAVHGLRFADVAADLSADRLGPNAHVVRVPPGLRRKRALLAAYHRALRLPGYFGWNWDALEECLGDLSWLAEPRRIVVVHADVPFAPGGRNRPDYLALLADLTADGAAIEAIFPPACRDEVARALSGSAGMTRSTPLGAPSPGLSLKGRGSPQFEPRISIEAAGFAETSPRLG